MPEKKVKQRYLVLDLNEEMKVRCDRQARRMGLPKSAYAKVAIIERIERDEAAEARRQPAGKEVRP